MAEAKKKPKSRRSLIVLIIILPVAAYLFREVVTTDTIWYFRIVDLVDLVVLTPVYIAVILYLFFYMARSGAPYSLQLVFLIFSLVFITGQTMHFTANSINSIDINRIMTFFRFRKIPASDRQNNIAPTTR